MLGLIIGVTAASASATNLANSDSVCALVPMDSPRHPSRLSVRLVPDV
jgi:hypothetical protein